ncbi:hypothetical protein EVJ58_g7167 [Rhodofomes roseus]|uniref:C2H2-type domain-containing protein n=1 Tax=Rhodofomes roseus TaxID=34475 RepID=A0A4Y9Y6I5_9APHY|nr:hypothetical protein EVJ58_g7167 [Rhodofomes roseus]
MDFRVDGVTSRSGPAHYDGAAGMVPPPPAYEPFLWLLYPDMICAQYHSIMDESYAHAQGYDHMTQTFIADGSPTYQPQVGAVLHNEMFHHSSDTSEQHQTDDLQGPSGQPTSDNNHWPQPSTLVAPAPSQNDGAQVTCCWDGCGVNILCTRDAVKAHYKEAHLKNVYSDSSVVAGTDKAMVRCRWSGCTCNEMHATNIWRHVYERHMHVVPKVQCERCSTQFTRKGSLDRHRLRFPACAAPVDSGL